MLHKFHSHSVCSETYGAYKSNSSRKECMYSKNVIVHWMNGCSLDKKILLSEWKYEVCQKYRSMSERIKLIFYRINGWSFEKIVLWINVWNFQNAFTPGWMYGVYTK